MRGPVIFVCSNRIVKPLIVFNLLTPKYYDLYFNLKALLIYGRSYLYFECTIETRIVSPTI